jgi:acyl carrier protein
MEVKVLNDEALEKIPEEELTGLLAGAKSAKQRPREWEAMADAGSRIITPKPWKPDDQEDGTKDEEGDETDKEADHEDQKETADEEDKKSLEVEKESEAGDKGSASSSRSNSAKSARQGSAAASSKQTSSSRPATVVAQVDPNGSGQYSVSSFQPGLDSLFDESNKKDASDDPDKEQRHTADSDSDYGSIRDGTKDSSRAESSGKQTNDNEEGGQQQTAEGEQQDHSDATAVRETVRKVFQSTFCQLVEPSSETDGNFFDKNFSSELGLDELDVTELIMYCEKEMGVMIPDGAMLTIQTPGALADYIADHQQPKMAA